MEHYFIYICNEKPTSEEHTLVLNYIHSLRPLPCNINHIHSDINSVPLLKCNSSYLAVINASSEEKTVEWTNITEELDLSHLLCGVKKEDCQKILEDDSNKVSEHFEDCPLKDSLKDDVNRNKIFSIQLDCLADELPVNGSYKLDVLISQNVLKGLSPYEGIEFAGSLYRLLRWHSAHTVIIIPKGEDELNLTEWCEIVEAEVLKHTIDPFLGPLIWRGSIQFKNSEISYSGFQLRLDPFESEITFSDTTTPSSILETNPYEYLALSSNFQAIHECSFTSIPIYLILPVAFRLYICEPNIHNINSKKLLEGLSSNNGAALIVRLKYSILHEKPKPDKSLSTSKWQKMISSGSIKGPDSTFPILEKYLTFAITASQKSDWVVAYPLRDPSSLDAKFCFDTVNAMQSKSQCFEVHKTSEKDLLTLEVPYLPQHSLQALVNKINILGLSSKETRCSSEHSSSDSLCCLESFLESVTKDLSSLPLALDNSNLHVIVEEIDPSDWPERVHLLQKQMQIEREKIKVQPVFRNLSPQRSQNTISFTSQDAGKYFLPTGEPRDETSTESTPVQIPNDTKPVEQNFDKEGQSKWPEALTCKTSDIYYNSDKQAEDKEAVGNEMVRFYVQHETACTCNNQQCRTDPTILIRSKSKPSNQKYRSPATPRSYSRIKLQKSNDPSDTSTSQANISSAMLKKNNSAVSDVKTANKAIKGQKLAKRNALPLRSSPRKKYPVKYSQPTARSTGEHKRKNSDPQQLPEILKKKLRVAVASALEKNGINLKDDFFRPCGKRLFTICQAFVQDIPIKGSTSQHMQKIADAHVKQVIEFERQRLLNLEDKGKPNAGN